MEYFLLAGLFVCCFFAVTTAVKKLIDYLLRPKCSTFAVTVIPVRSGDNGIEYAVRSLASECREIILLDLGADEEQLEICRCLGKEIPYAVLLTPDYLAEYIAEMS